MTGQTVLKARLWTGMLLLTGAATTFPASAQTTSTIPAPVFAVSTVKINNSGSGSSSGNYKDGRYVATNMSLKNVLHYQAYGVPEPRIFGGPEWLDSERFDIEAKADDSYPSHYQALNREQKLLE